LAAAVALRHLQLMHGWDVVANVRARSTQLRDALALRAGCRGAVRDIRVCGLFAGVELDAVAGGSRLARRVCAAMVQRGVLSRSLGDIITLVPPLTITASEIDRIVDALAAALDELGAA
jgi:adenosylmethionine-8-amino-7-oxononanoate aminotransferase